MPTGQTPETEAATAISALVGWARQIGVAIDIFKIAAGPPTDDRQIVVVGHNDKGEFFRNSFTIETLSDPHEVDAALISAARAKGWAEHTRAS